MSPNGWWAKIALGVMVQSQRRQVNGIAAVAARAVNVTPARTDAVRRLLAAYRAAQHPPSGRAADAGGLVRDLCSLSSGE